MDLSRRQKKELYEALLSAFPRGVGLELAVFLGLEENLEVIAGRGPLQDVVFRLVAWAESRDLLQELIDAAVEANPTNAALAAFVAALDRPSGLPESKGEEKRPSWARDWSPWRRPWG